ncbi:MAG: 16S rRNA (cytosine(967)-C(5))-methyltransferase RsmB [Clostridiales bacterium]|nr:16S rRNA (cytosine(967)-C(5))-methyltransferase RsmB [Clostridiales bacterium]
MVSAGRTAALTALEKMRRRGAWSDELLSTLAASGRLNGKDAALAARLCRCVLENRTLCDFYIAQYCSQPPERLEPKVLDILRLSVCQLLFLDRVPAHAAVSEGVQLCRDSGLGRAAGLVNAVLRRIAEHRDALPEVPDAGTAQHLAIRYSHPLWLAKRLIVERGYDFTEAFFRANNEGAPLYLQENTLRLTTEPLPGQAHPWLPGCRIADGAALHMPAFAEGGCYVQDPAARLAVMAAAPQPGMQVLDACAAPGGKTIAAAIAMDNCGEIVSCDLHEKKLRFIRENTARLGISIVQTRAMDARRPDAELTGRFDLVLADVPCSGLGVIRKKPEIREKKPEELERLPALQREILNGLCGCVRSGGVLLYSTCTVLSRENEAVVSAFLKEHPDFMPEEFSLPGELQSSGGMLTLWPHLHGTDGFFVCRMRKA